MSEHKIPIPSMIYNAAVGGHVTSSQQIIDENLNREQQDINEEVAAVPYNVSNPNGMGRIVLKKNDNFKQVVEAETDGNTIFVIKYDYTLTGDVTIPVNCILQFEGGSISAGSGENMNTITGNVNIQGKHCLNGIILSGLYPSGIKVSWFKNPVEAFNLNHNITNVPYSGGGIMISSIYVDESFETSVSLNVKTKTVIYGDCTNAIRIVMTDNTKPVFDFGNYNIDEVDICNLCIHGGKHVVYSSQGNVVKTMFENLFFFGQEDYCFYFDNAGAFIQCHFNDVIMHYSGGGIYINSEYIYSNIFEKTELIMTHKYGLFNFVATANDGIFNNIFRRLVVDSGTLLSNVIAAIYIQGKTIVSNIFESIWLENIKDNNNILLLPIKIEATGTTQQDVMYSQENKFSNLISSNGTSEDIIHFSGDFKDINIENLCVITQRSSLVKKHIKFISGNSYNITLFNSPNILIQGNVIYNSINDIENYVSQKIDNFSDKEILIHIEAATDSNKNMILKQSHNGSNYGIINSKVIGSKLYSDESCTTESATGNYYKKEAIAIILPITNLGWITGPTHQTWYINIDSLSNCTALRTFINDNPKTCGNIKNLAKCVNLVTFETYETNVEGDWKEFVIGQIMNGRTTGSISIGYATSRILVNGAKYNSGTKNTLSWDSTSLTIKDANSTTVASCTFVVSINNV